MSVQYLQRILRGSSRIVCLLGRASAGEKALDLYEEAFVQTIKEKYGRTPEEIVSRTFYYNSPAAFYRFYREELLAVRGEPDEVDLSLKRMEEDGKLNGIITDGLFDLTGRAGCRKVVHMNGSVENNRCTRCGKVFDAEYILSAQGLPVCPRCGCILYPGIVLQGELPDKRRVEQAAEMIKTADILLLVETDLQAPLGALVKYFSGDRICIVRSTPHPDDATAECVCIGPPAEIMKEAYPAG